MSARYLAWLYGATGRQSQSEALYRGLIEDAGQSWNGPSVKKQSTRRIGLASLLQKEGRSSRGGTLAARRRRLPATRPSDPAIPIHLSTQNVLARTLKALGRFDEAEATLRETLETRRQVIGPEHPFTLVTDVRAGRNPHGRSPAR